jgi:hypothetical protein
MNEKVTLGHAIAGCMLLGMVATSALAEVGPPEDLLRDLGAVAGTLGGTSGGGGSVNARAVKVKPGWDRPAVVDVQKLRAERINLNLFQGTNFVAVRDRIVEHGNGDSDWVGHLEAEPGSEVVLAVGEGTLAGTVKRENGELYEIAYQGNGTHRVRQLDPTRLPSHAHPIATPRATSVGVQGATVASGSTTPTTSAATSTTATVVDLMVVYTPKARANAGGATGIRTKINNAVAAANQAYLNSKINMQLRLVYAAEVPYTETGNMTRTLYDLQGMYDGKMDVVHQWRDTYGADQVALVTADSTYCGLGYQMNYLASWFESYAFSVVHDDSRYACLSNQTLAHELGHNQGNAHDRASSSSPGIYSYSYGYRLCKAGGFRTIMAYPCSGANLISYFANPSITVNGKVVGLDPKLYPSTSAADAWSMSSAVATVADWRPAVPVSGTSPVATAPLAPAKLAASPAAADRIELQWMDSSDNEAGFRVEHSLDGSDWTEIANLPPGAIRFTHTGLAPATLYRYRVRAYNGVGVSDSANETSAQTPAAPKRLGSDTRPPLVKIEKPGDGTAIGNLVGIVAGARDDYGIGSLKLYIDGRLRGATGADALAYQWNTQGVAPGLHTIEVVAADLAGNLGRASVRVRK